MNYFRNFARDNDWKSKVVLVILKEIWKFKTLIEKCMIERKLQICKELDGSIFLFGARQTGKSTILRQQFPNAIYIDLLDTEIKAR